MTAHAVNRGPRQLVYLSVRMQPPAHRDRYLRELMAELYLIPGSQQLGHAARVFATSWALRSALTEPAPASIGGTTVIRTPAPPLSCRLRLWHKWQWVTTEDGGRYEACMRCGRDRSRPTRPTPDMSGGGTTM